MTSTIPTTPFKKPPFFYEEVEGLHADHLRYIDGERDDIWTLAKIRIAIDEQTGH